MKQNLESQDNYTEGKKLKLCCVILFIENSCTAKESLSVLTCRWQWEEKPAADGGQRIT